MQPFLIQADAMSVLPDLDCASVDLVMLDLPYGRTNAPWDRTLDPAALWQQLRRILTPRGTVLSFATQPFGVAMAAPAIDLLKYSLVWKKTKPTGHFHVANRPLATHEDIYVFSKGAAIHDHATDRRMTYNVVGASTARARVKMSTSAIYRICPRTPVGQEYDAITGAPRSVLEFAKDSLAHPSAKPLGLLEWLIAAYSHPGDAILDPTMGSGSSIMAAQRLGRWGIGIERDRDIFETARARIADDICDDRREAA